MSWILITLFSVSLPSLLTSASSLQVRYGRTWSDNVGGTHGDLEEIFLYPGESVIQVSGKYKHYLRKLVFITSKGRRLSFGGKEGISFNAVPLHPNTVLRYISGRATNYITAIGLHWGTYHSNQNNCWSFSFCLPGTLCKNSLITNPYASNLINEHG